MQNENQPDEILPEEEVLFDLSTSCTIDEATIRLLGWGTNTVVRKYIRITEDGISDDELMRAHPSTLSLSERLEEMQRNARNAIIASAENDATYEELSALDAKINQVRELAAQAINLKRAIADEVTKGSASMLRLDAAEGQKRGEVCITINSLNDWYTAYTSNTSVTAISAKDDASLLNKLSNPPKKPPRTKMRDQEKAILATLKELGHDPKLLPPYLSGKRGVKAKVRDLLNSSPLFTAIEAFDAAWERLSKNKEIVYQQ